MEDNADGGTVNTSANAIGVSGGQSLGPGEAARIDFVVDLTGSPPNGNYGTLANQNHAFDSHYNANGASALFTNITNSSSVRLVERDDIDTAKDIGRSEERRVGQECVSTGTERGETENSKKKKK